MPDNHDSESPLENGWYVQLAGHKFDLKDWELLLRPPFDPHVVVSGGETLLRSEDFEDQELDVVRERAARIIDRLNGAMSLHSGARPLSIAAVIRVRDGGARDAYVSISATLEARSHFSAVGQAIGADGEVLPAPCSEPQRWHALAESNDAVEDLLSHYGRAIGWYEIYKSAEAAEDVVGGEAKLKALLGGSAAKFKLMKRTANYHRHARAKPPPKLMSLDEARKVLKGAVRIAIDAAAGATNVGRLCRRRPDKVESRMSADDRKTRLKELLGKFRDSPAVTPGELREAVAVLLEDAVDRYERGINGGTFD